MDELVLKGIDGANPLGFLSAIGALVIADEIWPGQAFLSWIKDSSYKPIIRLPYGKLGPVHASLVHRQSAIARKFASSLKVPTKAIPEEDEMCVEELYKKFNRKRKTLDKSIKQLRDKIKELNRLGRERGMKDEDLKQWVGEQSAESKSAVVENERVLQFARELWLEMLEIIAPSEELCLGKTLSITKDEYRNAALLMGSKCNSQARRSVDFLAAFAAESLEDKGIVRHTPFCFVTGSGHQYFLDTVGKLMQKADAHRLEQCLFHPWRFEDDRLSLRWAPVEDRRYALMWNDPSGEGARTVWAANLLAYNGLRLFPIVDVGGRLSATGFAESNDKQLFFTWPIWDGFLHLDTVRALLAHRLLRDQKPDHRIIFELSKLGVMDIFRCQRLRVGTPPLEKLNFSTPNPI